MKTVPSKMASRRSTDTSSLLLQTAAMALTIAVSPAITAYAQVSGCDQLLLNSGLTDGETTALKAACPEAKQQATSNVMFADAMLPASVGGPDAFGYTFDDSTETGGPVYNFENISTTGTSISLGDDQLSAPISIGFNFNYYGTDYTQISVSSNGFLTVSPYSSGCCTGRALPSNDWDNGVIAGWWEDLEAVMNFPICC